MASKGTLIKRSKKEQCEDKIKRDSIKRSEKNERKIIAKMERFKEKRAKKEEKIKEQRMIMNGETVLSQNKQRLDEKKFVRYMKKKKKFI
jgi:hypothetical protein